jgi:putative transposase
MPTRGTYPRLHSFDYRRQRTYFVTFCAKNRRSLFADPTAARIAKQVVVDYRDREWFWLLSYCIMPDHVHLLLRLWNGDRSLSQVVGVIKNQITYRARRVHLCADWQKGFHDRVKRADEDERYIARYIVENPVRAGLVERYDQYEFAGIVDDWR